MHALRVYASRKTPYAARGDAAFQQFMLTCIWSCSHDAASVSATATHVIRRVNGQRSAGHPSACQWVESQVKVIINIDLDS